MAGAYGTSILEAVALCPGHHLRPGSGDAPGAGGSLGAGLQLGGSVFVFLLNLQCWGLAVLATVKDTYVYDINHLNYARQ